MQFAGQDLVTGGADRLHLLLGQHSQFAVGLGGSPFDHGQGIDEMGEILQRHAGDGEVFHAAQGLYPVVGGKRHIAVPQQVVLAAHGCDQRFRSGLAGKLIGGIAQPLALPLGHPGNDPIEDIRVGLLRTSSQISRGTCQTVAPLRVKALVAWGDSSIRAPSLIMAPMARVERWVVEPCSPRTISTSPSSMIPAQSRGDDSWKRYSPGA